MGADPWRAAVILVPEAQKNDLAEELAAQLGRGDRHVQLSLSRALIALGADVIEPQLRTAFGPALDEAKRTFALRNAPRP